MKGEVDTYIGLDLLHLVETEEIVSNSIVIYLLKKDKICDRSLAQK